MADTITRGSVWWVDLPLDPESHVQGGVRPCVIVSADSIMYKSGTVLACPLSTKLDSYPLHPKVFIRKIGQVICNQIMTLDKSSLQDYVGNLTDIEMQAVNLALAKCLGTAV